MENEEFKQFPPTLEDVEVFEKCITLNDLRKSVNREDAKVNGKSKPGIERLIMVQSCKLPPSILTEWLQSFFSILIAK